MTIAEIEKIVCSGENISPETLHENYKTRILKIRECRQIIMYFAITELHLHTTETGMFFNKDHSTAVHARKTIENLIQTDRSFSMKIESYRTDIKSVISLKKIVVNFAEMLKPLLNDVQDIEVRLSAISKILYNLHPKLEAYLSFAGMLKSEIEILNNHK